VNHDHAVPAGAGHLLLPTSLAAVLVALLAASALSAVALAAARHLRARGDGWPARRSLAAVAAAGCLPVALALPDALRTPPFTGLVVQHVVLVVVLPVVLVLSAPVTLALRTLPRRLRRLLLAVVHGAWARAVLSAPVVVALQVSGNVVAFLTPLHHALAGRPVLALVLHAHMVLAGCAFAAFAVGRDPLPRPPGPRTRLVVLVLVGAAHDVVARLLLAHPPAGETLPDVTAGAHLLVAAGTVGDVGLAVLVLARWYAAGGRRLAHERRRAAQAVASPPNSAVSPRAT